MDDTTRKAPSESATQPIQSIMDAYGAAPLNTAHIQFEESATRSTQATPESTFQPVNPGGAAAGKLYDPADPTYPPLPDYEDYEDEEEHPSHHSVAPEHVDGIVVHEGEYEVTDHATGLYMINAQKGSWSASLASENDLAVQATFDPQTTLTLDKIRRRQQPSNQLPSQDLADIASQVVGRDDDYLMRTPAEVEKAKQDYTLRQVIFQIKRKLSEGAVIMLERMGDVNFTTVCAHPYCPAREKLVQPGAYYFTLGDPHQLESAGCYCLFCLQGLWNGTGLTGVPPPPQVRKKAVNNVSTATTSSYVPMMLDGAMDDDRLLSASIAPDTITPTWTATLPIRLLSNKLPVRAQLDGNSDPPELPHQLSRTSPFNQSFTNIPESLLSSKHAPSLEELASATVRGTVVKTPTVSPLSVPETPGSPVSSSDSINSEREWRHPPTRAQHLAEFIKPGNSLNEVEKAAVEVWKAVSKEQLHWNDFQEKCTQTRNEYRHPLDALAYEVPVGGAVASPGEQAGWTQGMGEHVRVVAEEDEDEEVEFEEKAGLLKKWCQGKDLTEVLAEVRSRR